MRTSGLTQEPVHLFDVLSKWESFFGSKSFCNLGFNGQSSIYSNLRFDGFETLVGEKREKPKVVASLGLSRSTSRIQRIWRSFNRVVRLHCERIPIGFASVGGVSSGENGLGEHGCAVLDEENLNLNGVEAEKSKKVLILMSDTGGGHRASAEAIKATFNEEFGDEYQVFVTDLWSDHTPWPFNQLPRSYNFLVKHGPLWKLTYYGSAPRVVHQSNFAATSTFIAREVAKGLMKYQPDIIISVHPLMQHVPLRILRAKGLLEKIVFTTVVTDLSTCHPTWYDLLLLLLFTSSFITFVFFVILINFLLAAVIFRFHKLVTRCYCPTTEVAKRALKAGLQPSQIKVYGLPVRPSFVKPVRPKVELRRELGMDQDLPAVLLMGGGEGMGPIEATARALGNSLYDETIGEPIGQVLVICGRNKKLANRLLSIDWKIPVQVKGFVTKMEECMGACDCIITKAGPGTIAEAMIRGLPIILNDYIAGQVN
ncbi:monogalactosyldiacylglycerol synthase, chloroplastic-like isoform X1 [Macadamia integrifolia]|uniref:monogalactosyldiacylglycerol synthase, chloroplastic-like isoform X1 n=1 Tax=Macadamia integrifolia TaxID=60698 RepID=UPI001C4E4C90|nr:monogalactosyldiacylglycerol synthase, chloroplastic-like isoform X1 [Macadamia integrifolia]